MPNTIQFYLPFHKDGLDSIPTRAEDYWQWILDHPDVAEGKYSWTLQTYLRLKDRLPCRLAEHLPTSGIVVSHRDFLPVLLLPRDIFLVCIKADRNAHTWANFHVVQNEHDPIRRTPKGLRNSAAMTFWPQAGLIPRDVTREDRCENVAFLGRGLNLATELRGEAWACKLKQAGFDWSVRTDRSQWSDYRGIDEPRNDSVFDPRSKPANKLINSWLAGVPAIVGPEPAYRQARRSRLDFLQVESVEDLGHALNHLRIYPSLYREMVENGLERAKEFSQDAVADQWVHLCRDVLPERYREWAKRSPLHRSWAGYWRIASYFTEPRHVRSVYEALIR
jgi:hypothetical protein